MTEYTKHKSSKKLDTVRKGTVIEIPKFKPTRVHHLEWDQEYAVVGKFMTRIDRRSRKRHI